MFITSDMQRHAGKYYGKYGAEVIDNKDDENLGRIMVKVPAVFGPECEPVQAWPCFPFGHFFVPANESMVWVEFEAGNIAYPIWVGSWYKEGETPQQAAIDPPDNRVIQTPSGHTIEILDKDGEEKIVIKHKSNAFVSIDKEGSVLLANKEGSHLSLNAKDGNAALMEQHQNVITMGSDGTVLVNKDGTTVELKGDMARIVAKDIVLQGTSVSLGPNAMEPAILGQTFMGMWNPFIFHTHATAMGPSGPPTPPTQPLAPGSGLTSAVVVK